MGFHTSEEVLSMGFKHVGKNVLISNKASLYNLEKISVGDHSRIDDFCVLSGEITIGRNVHITAFNNLLAGRARIVLHDFSTLAFGCHIVAQSDDYSGETLTNSTIPAEYKNEISQAVSIGRHAILGTGSIVLPGVTIGNGVSAGAATLFTSDAQEWSIYVGSPARRIKSRSQELLKLEAEYLKEYG
jgi:acetyltransferase-like isoleucine patch superfamily enzyme